MAQKKAKLRWDLQQYMPAFSVNMDVKELRKEYTRLRKIAQKRLERFVGTEWERSEVFKKNYGQYPKLADIPSESRLRYELAALARFINAETSSVSGLRQQRAKTIEALRDKGYTFVNKNNYWQFGEFMDYYKTSKLNQIYDSEAALTVFQMTERFNIPERELSRNFETYLSKAEEIENMEVPRNPRARNSDYIREKLGIK